MRDQRSYNSMISFESRYIQEIQYSHAAAESSFVTTTHADRLGIHLLSRAL